MTTPSLTFSSVEELCDLLTTGDWAYTALSVPDDDGGQVETGFRLLVCPYCWAAVPDDAEPFQAKTQHVEHHRYELTLLVIASAGIGVGLSLTRAEAERDADG